MKTIKTCTECNSQRNLKLRLEFNAGDVGWFCTNCNSFWGLDKSETKLCEAAIKATRQEYSRKVKAITKLREAFTELGIIESNEL